MFLRARGHLLAEYRPHRSWRCASPHISGSKHIHQATTNKPLLRSPVIYQWDEAPQWCKGRGRYSLCSCKKVEESSAKPMDFISQKQLTAFSIICLPISNLLSNQLLIFRTKRCLIFWTKKKMVESIWEWNIDILEDHCSEINFTEILWMTHTAILNFSQRISTLSKLSHQSLLCFFRDPYLLEIV